MRTPNAFLVAAVALCCTLAVGCGSSSKNSSSSPPTSAATPTSAANASAQCPGTTKPAVSVPKGAPPTTLVSTDLKQGTGAPAKAGDSVTVQYVGVNYADGKQFDASWDHGQPFTFTLGTGSVIAGWDRGVAGMKVCGRRELVIPPSLGYGAQANGPIQANETLVFVIDRVG